MKKITQDKWKTFNIRKQYDFMILHEKFPEENLLNHLKIDFKFVRDTYNAQRRAKSAARRSATDNEQKNKIKEELESEEID
ncbi:MAG: hypothetical protein ACRC2M_05155, partial [Planktothrix sp.]